MNIMFDDFGEDYFEGHRFDDGGHPAGYSNYGEEPLPHDRFAKKIKELVERMEIDCQTVLVAGCGYGHTVTQLREESFTAFGVDISSWAIGRGQLRYLPSRLAEADITSKQEIQNAIQKFGVGSFDVVYSECVLECLSDEDAKTACANIRDIGETVIHHLYTSGSNLDDRQYNLKPLSRWIEICDENQQDMWISHEEFLR